MLSNAYFLAKFRFDTAENEPAKNLQNFRKMHFRKIQRCHLCTAGAVSLAQGPSTSDGGAAGGAVGGPVGGPVGCRTGCVGGCIAGCIGRGTYVKIESLRWVNM